MSLPLFSANMRPLDEYIRHQLNNHIDEIGDILDADVMAIISPILPGLEVRVRHAVELISQHKGTLAIVLETPGGIVEVVERMVDTIRNYYQSVVFIVPNRAMSAGTVFVMSGNRILMDFFSCLGPIDPQIEKDGKLVPALAYLNQFERLNEKAQQGNLTSAEYALLSKLDLGELYQFEQARALSIELLVKWLSSYKFEHWHQTETKKKQVTPQIKETRAKEIAETLSKNEYWHSHGRGINMKILTDVLNLKIEDYSVIPNLGSLIKEYHELLQDYMNREQINTFVHTKEFF